MYGERESFKNEKEGVVSLGGGSSFDLLSNRGTVEIGDPGEVSRADFAGDLSVFV